MRKFVSVLMAAALSCAFAFAAERGEFETVDIIEDSAVLSDMASVAPVDGELYADVMAQLSDFCTMLSLSGDFSSANAVSTWVMMNKNYFTSSQLKRIKRYLEGIDEEQFELLQMAQFKNPDVSLLLSIFLGMFGVDRFYLGQPIAGLVKLLTGGGFVIWWFVDVFFISRATRNANYREFFNYLDMIQ